MRWMPRAGDVSHSTEEHMSRLTRAVTLASVAAVLVAPAGAQADAASPATQTPQATIDPGSLDFTTAPSVSDFGPVTLDGRAQSANAQVNDWGVDDSEGTGASWQVTAVATQFATSDSSETLPMNSLTMVPPATVTADSGQSADEAPTAEAPAEPLDNPDQTPQVIASAAAGDGMGNWSFHQANATGGDLALGIPADARAGTYTSTITFTVQDTPSS